MTIDAFHNRDGGARGDHDLIGERRRARPRRAGWALLLAWLWPGFLNDGVLQRQDALGAYKAARPRNGLGRRRLILAAMLSTALALPGFMGGKGALEGRLEPFKAGAAAGGGQGANRGGAGGAGAGGAGGGGPKAAVRAHGQPIPSKADDTWAPEASDAKGQAGGQSPAVGASGDGSEAAPGESEGDQQGLTFFDSNLTGAGDLGSLGSSGGGIHAGLGGGLGGGSGGGGLGGAGPPGGQPVAPGGGGDQPPLAGNDPDAPTGGDPQGPPTGEHPTEPGPPAGEGPIVDGPPIFDEVGPKIAAPSDLGKPSEGRKLGGPKGPNSPTSAAPEPQAWLLMIVGFGAVGCLLRRRRASAAV